MNEFRTPDQRNKSGLFFDLKSKINSKSKGLYFFYNYFFTADGLSFKDSNRKDKLDEYEDWRLPFEERAKDLVKKRSVKESGLQAHQFTPIKK